MRNIITIAKHNLKSVLKNWFWLIFILPIVANIVLPVLGMDESSLRGTSFKLGVYTEDNGEIYEKILPKEKFGPIKTAESKEEIKKMVEGGKVSAGVIIDSDDIYSDIKENKDGVIEIVSYDDSVSKAFVLNVINNGINQILSFGNSKEEVLNSYDQYNDLKYSFEYEDNNLVTMIAHTIMFGLFCMAFLFIAGKSLSPLIKEKESKIDKRILVSKVSRVEYEIGHILGCILLLLAQSLILVVGMYIFNNNFDISIIWMIVLCVALSIVGISIALFVKSISNSSTMYYTLLSMIIMPIAVLSGGLAPIDMMGDTIRKISLISPLTWVNSAFKKMMLDAGSWKIGMDLLAGVAISMVFIMLYLVIESKKNTSEYL